MRRILSLVDSGEGRGYVGALIGFLDRGVRYRKRVVEVGGKRMLRLYVGGIDEDLGDSFDVGDQLRVLESKLVVSEDQVVVLNEAIVSLNEALVVAEDKLRDKNKALNESSVYYTDRLSTVNDALKALRELYDAECLVSKKSEGTVKSLRVLADNYESRSLDHVKEIERLANRGFWDRVFNRI